MPQGQWVFLSHSKWCCQSAGSRIFLNTILSDLAASKQWQNNFSEDSETRSQCQVVLSWALIRSRFQLNPILLARELLILILLVTWIFQWRSCLKYQQSSSFCRWVQVELSKWGSSIFGGPKNWSTQVSQMPERDLASCSSSLRRWLICHDQLNWC